MRPTWTGCGMITLVGLLFVQVSAALAEFPTRVVAETEQYAAGVGNGRFSRFSTPQVDAVGCVGFLAYLYRNTGGVTSGDDVGIWAEQSGRLTLIRRKGTIDPRTGGMFSLLYDTVTFNSAGQLTFRALMYRDAYGVTGENNSGVWGGLKLTREGSYASGYKFADFRNPAKANALNAVGRKAFTGSYVDAQFTFPTGIWSEGSGHLRRVAVEGGSVPGIAGGVFSYFTSLAMSDTGFLVFYAYYYGTPPGSNGGHWYRNPITARTTLLATKGGQAPDMESGAVFSDTEASHGAAGVNNAGEVAFLARFTPALGRATSVGFPAIWAGQPDDLRVVARWGDQAPGTPPGTTFVSLTRSVRPVIRGDGKVAFYAGARDADDNFLSGIWIGDENSLEVLAHTGDQAPSFSRGVTFTSFRDPIFNEAGRIAFTATVSSGQDCIFAESLGGRLMAVRCEGDEVRLADGAFHAIGTLTMQQGQGGQDGRGSCFNNNGYLTYIAGFTGGMKAVLADVAAFDCNDNTIPDSWDIGLIMTSLDCNLTGVPDECETLQNGDYDADMFVDVKDHAALVGCLNGPQQPSAPPVAECHVACHSAFDEDGDSDVDLRDFARFQTAFSPPPS